MKKLFGPALGDRSDVLDHLALRHPDAVIDDRERALFRIRFDPNVKLSGRAAGGANARGELLETLLVERGRGVRNKLAQKDVLVRIERVDHELEGLFDIGLEFGTLAHLGTLPGPCATCGAHAPVALVPRRV